MSGFVFPPSVKLSPTPELNRTDSTAVSLRRIVENWRFSLSLPQPSLSLYLSLSKVRIWRRRGRGELSCRRPPPPGSTPNSGRLRRAPSCRLAPCLRRSRMRIGFGTDIGPIWNRSSIHVCGIRQCQRNSELRIRIFEEEPRSQVRKNLNQGPSSPVAVAPMMTKVSAAVLIRLCHRNRVVQVDPPLLALLLADFGQPQNHSAAAKVAETRSDYANHYSHTQVVSSSSSSVGLTRWVGILSKIAR